ncbi:hypothetical protein [Nannocystis bainbridge]|uniref:Uncharacterized protein n=1 Tax=Nannocystis bainbridge TaxID=2995303 RepID=A0ABT5DWP9_9BACT|nr:hypothetical protein [Nannocystis bainbridge]MDC0718064.1 hypothetical protein [Nannocystis bainbridge]
MSAEAPLDRTLAVLAPAGLGSVLVLGLRHSDNDHPLPFYRPFLLAGFWLELSEGVVWFDNHQGILTATPAVRPEPPASIDSDSLEDLCILDADGFLLDPAREPAAISTLELVAEHDEALREVRIAAVFLRCTDGAELFAHAWSFEGVTFGRAPEYAAWREENPYFKKWGRYRWDATNTPWTWASRQRLPMLP